MVYGNSIKKNLYASCWSFVDDKNKKNGVKLQSMKIYCFRIICSVPGWIFCWVCVEKSVCKKNLPGCWLSTYPKIMSVWPSNAKS